MDSKDVWGVDESVIEKNLGLYKFKHGMFASIPILCGDKKCPYLEVCTVNPNDRKLGGRCPMEIAAITARFDSWCNHFGIEIINGEVKDEDLADVSLIKDLVDNEVQTIRAENRIAMNGDFIGQTIAEIDNKCKVYREDTIIPEAEYKMSLQEKRYKILQLLNATRKDKVKELQSKDNVSKQVIDIFNKINKNLNKDLDDLDDSDFEDEELENQDTVKNTVKEDNEK